VSSTLTEGGDAAAPAAGRGHPVRRILVILAFVVAAGALANLLGWDIRGWFEQVWDTITSISAAYVVAAIIAVTVQTTATAYAWYSILRFAYPGEVSFRQVLAAYATCVALNNILPANLGTIVMFVMLTTVIASATFAGLIGGFAVQKIFFTIVGAFVFIYLFFTVPGSFDISFSFIKENPWATAALLVGGIAMLVVAIRSFWPKVVKWWDQAKEGGKVLTHPGAYFGRVFLPELVAWVAANGRLPVVTFTAGGIATPADAALCSALGAQAIVYIENGDTQEPLVKKLGAQLIKSATPIRLGHWQELRASTCPPLICSGAM